MSVISLILLLLGVVALVFGIFRIARNRAWVDGLILVVVGLILLAVGGFVHL